MQATKKELIYEGKGKKMWSVNESDDLLISEFTLPTTTSFSWRV